MDALRTSAAPDADGRLRAFRATDAFALEAFQAMQALGRTEGAALAREIRRVAARSGGALVAASAASPGEPAERRALESARSGLLEVRYYLYLARRLGFLELRRYRRLASQQDAALRELDGLLEPGRPAGLDRGQAGP